MEPPIILFDGNDLMVFETPESAEGFVEAPDAVGVTYDASGRVLRFETDGRVTTLTETDELRPDVLRADVLRVSAINADAMTPDASLSDLVVAATRRCQVLRHRFL